MTEKRRRANKRKKIKNRLMNAIGWPLLALLGVATLVALSPVLLPALAFAGWLAERRKRAAAIRFRCTNCGLPLGEVSLSLADAAHAENWERRRRDHPNVKFRIIRTFDAICPHCGRRYLFVEKENAFTEEAL